MDEAETNHNTGPKIGDQFHSVEAHGEATSPVAAIVEPAPGASIEDARADLAQVMALADHFNTLDAELAEAHADTGTAWLEKSGVQLGMLIQFYENATGHRDDRHAPLLKLFEALVNRINGGDPSMLFPAPRPAGVKTKPNVRFRDIARAYLAAAADILLAANMARGAVVTWWGNAAEAKRVLRWRDEISAGTAPPLVAYVFHELRPVVRQPIDLLEAESLARQWRAVVQLRKIDP